MALTLLAGCGRSVEVEPLPQPAVTCGVPPAWLAPVELPPVKDSDGLNLLGPHRKAIVEANWRLTKGRESWLQVGSQLK